jgi:hypothetical protein
VKVLLSFAGSVVFSLVVHCVSSVLTGLQREDIAHGALAYLAIYAILSGREGGAE